jgi:PAS domain S-box-containing protein
MWPERPEAKQRTVRKGDSGDGGPGADERPADAELRRTKEQLERVIAHNADGMLVVGDAGEVLFANAAAARILDRDRDTLVGSVLGIPVGSDDPVEIEVLAGGGPPRCVELRTAALDWEGRSATLVSLRDISERKAAEARLRASEERFRLVLRSSSLVVAAVDRDLRYEWIHNPHPDFDTAGVVGKRDDELASGPDIERLVAFKQSVLDAGVEQRAELSFRRSDGVRTYDFIAQPIRAASGEVIGLTTAALDISQRKRDEEEMLALNRELRSLLAANRAVIESACFAQAAEAICRICQEQTGAAVGYVALRRSADEDEILFSNPAQVAESPHSAESMPITGLRAEVYRRNQTVFVNEIQPGQSADSAPAVALRVQNAMLVPIALDGRVEGLIGLADKDGGFDAVDAWRAHALGEVAALSLDRSRHLAALETSETLHRQAQEVAHVGHWALDSPEGTPRWSDEIFRIFGLDPQRAPPSFTQHDTIVHPDEWSLLDVAIRAGFRQAEPFDLVFRILRRDGAVGWMRAIGQPRLDERGNTVEMFGTAQDITELKAAQQRLEQRERLLSTITDNMFDLVALADEQGRFDYVSPSFRQLGYAPHELQGRLVHVLVHPDDRVRILDELARLKENPGQYRKAEHRYRRADGSYAWLESLGRVLVDDQGKTTGMIFSSRDITERRRLEAQLAQSDRLSSMGMLAAGVAHEIKNPLSYVLFNLESSVADLPEQIRAIRRLHTALTELTGPHPASDIVDQAAAALNPTLLADILARLDDAQEGAHRIRDIARGLGTFSRVEKDELVPVDLRHVIDVAAHMAANEIKYRARLVKDYRKVPPVIAGEGRLSQVFLNLLINATHAIDEGDAEGNEIRVRTWAEGDSVYAAVSDSGSGIPEEHLGQLFEPFFSTKEIGTGSGLGLAISKNIVESYGGAIEVHSEVGRGTRFTIQLPAGTDRADAAEPPAAPADAPGKHGRVLIVDDEAGIRAIMARMLRGHETVQTASGAEAKALLQRDQSFDVVLCDMMMPEVSGIDLHRWLAQEHPALAERLIFITGGAFTPRARAYLNEVDNLRLEKPFDAANFKRIIRDRIALAQSEKARRG